MTRIAVSSILVVVSACGQAPRARPAKPPPPVPSISGSDLTFAGWDGSSSLIRKEETAENGRLKVSYLALGSSPRPVPAHAAPDLPPGEVLVRDYTDAASPASARFEFDAPAAQVQALESAIEAWWKEGSQKGNPFPVIQARFRVFLRDAAGERLVWEQKRDLSAVISENGYHWEPPRLRFASLAPSRSALLVELVSAGVSEFVRIPLHE